MGGTGPGSIDVPPDPGSPIADASANPDPPDSMGEMPPPCMGFALSLDGSNFASIPRPVEDDFTLEAWIQTSASLSGTNAFAGRGLLDADISGMGENNDFSTGVLNDRLAFGVGNPDTTVQGITLLTTGQWVHVAVTRRASNGQLQIIVNGALDGSGTSSNRNALSAPMAISFGGAVLSRHFIGLIDEVKIWSVVRSVQQVASDMRERPSAAEADLVGYYPFEDQGTLQTADISALGVDATLSGGPTYVPSSALCSPR